MRVCSALGEGVQARCTIRIAAPHPVQAGGPAHNLAGLREGWSLEWSSIADAGSARANQDAHPLSLGRQHRRAGLAEEPSSTGHDPTMLFMWGDATRLN